MKKCSICKRNKPVNQYSKNDYTRDKLCKACKDCGKNWSNRFEFMEDIHRESGLSEDFILYETYIK